MEKLNIVIGAFFSEVGSRFLSVFSGADRNIESINERRPNA